jgi:hypothetical protein
MGGQPMRKARLVLLSAFLLTTPICWQVGQHAPTREQCRTDAEGWNIPKVSALVPNDYKFRNLTRDVAKDQHVTAKSLNARIDEMSMCMRTDSRQSFRYDEGSRAYNIAIDVRMTDFVSRHNLLTQFYQEDEQGQR